MQQSAVGGTSLNCHQNRRILTLSMILNSTTRSVSAFICVHRRLIFLFYRHRFTRIHSLPSELSACHARWACRLRRFEFVREFVQGFACQVVCPESARSTDRMDGMNRMDMMPQNNIQILCIL